jgi:hypothetical protein
MTAIELCDIIEPEAKHPSWAIEFAKAFAKYHVTKALKSATKKGRLKQFPPASSTMVYSALVKDFVIDEDSILTAYPLIDIV